MLTLVFSAFYGRELLVNALAAALPPVMQAPGPNNGPRRLLTDRRRLHLRKTCLLERPTYLKGRPRRWLRACK